jgi:glyoxylase-like metal-dependent hydrolase (beta-lactamase superfamily II)
MENITTIDLWEGGKPGRTCGYLINAEKLTLVETGPGPAGERILCALEENGFHPADLRYVIVTHIHLDHAGAAGYLLSKCPNARLVVHPSGARHMAEPSRLIAGAKAAFDNFDSLFQPVIPVPEERILTVQDNSTLDLGDRQLTFLHGRGHANHHLTILDNLSAGLFSGDLLGIYSPEFAEYEIEYSLLSSAPNQFDPQSFIQSLEKIRSIQPTTIYFSHYGIKTGLTDHYLDLCLKNLELYCQVTKDICIGGGSSWQEIALHLKRRVKDMLVEMGWPKERSLPDFIESNINLNAKGLLDWWIKCVKNV